MDAQSWMSFSESDKKVIGLATSSTVRSVSTFSSSSIIPPSIVFTSTTTSSTSNIQHIENFTFTEPSHGSLPTLKNLPPTKDFRIKHATGNQNEYMIRFLHLPVK